MKKEHNFKDLKGLRFNRLTVLKLDSFAKNGAKWFCICDCGNSKIVGGSVLRSGGTKSCGCLRREVTTLKNLTNNPGISTHGMSGTSEWNAFKDARRRCTDPKNPRWKDYGGRGIKFLFESFEEFFSYIGLKPRSSSEFYSLDRIDNNGNYEPGNIRWTTAKEQTKNSRLKRDSTGTFIPCDS